MKKSLRSEHVAEVLVLWIDKPREKSPQVQKYKCVCVCVCVCVGTMALCLRVSSAVGTPGDSSEDRRDPFLSANISLTPYFSIQEKLGKLNRFNFITTGRILTVYKHGKYEVTSNWQIFFNVKKISCGCFVFNFQQAVKLLTYFLFIFTHESETKCSPDCHQTPW